MAAPRKKDEQDILKAAMTPETEPEDTIAEKPAIKGKGKVKKKPAPVKPQIIGPKEAMITYVPLDEGDPVFTIWYGIKFAANVPKKVTNRELITSAIKNPWFSVDGKPPPKRPARRKPRDTSDDVKSIAVDEKNEVEVEDALAEEPFEEDVN